eukprot:COSAG01_NODE_769_length_13735_cov_41.389410_15_plen_43_part_01
MRCCVACDARARLVQKVVQFGSWVQKVVHFPSDNSDLLSSHFS